MGNWNLPGEGPPIHAARQQFSIVSNLLTQLGVSRFWHTSMRTADWSKRSRAIRHIKVTSSARLHSLALNLRTPVLKSPIRQQIQIRNERRSETGELRSLALAQNNSWHVSCFPIRTLCLRSDEMLKAT